MLILYSPYRACFYCTKIVLFNICILDKLFLVDNVFSTIDFIEYSIGEKVWKEESDTFAAMGDDNGLLIIAKLGRIWLWTDKPAEVHPVTVTIQGPTSLHYKIVDLPYHIDVVPS